MSKPASPRKVSDKEALAVGTMIRGSARKLNLVAGLIRGRKVEEALNILKFSPKAMSEDVYKVLASAVAVAVSSKGPPALTTPLATASPGSRVTGRLSPVSADSSSTAGCSRSRAPTRRASSSCRAPRRRDGR